jgi:uncharacterized delta-60 repeat protein
VGGFFSSYNDASQYRITRLNSNGTRDTGFDTNTGFSPAGTTVNTIVIQPDGRILVGGSFTSYQGAGTRRYITRLQANGSGATSLGTGTNASVLSIALQSDGKILLGGDFIAYSDELLASPYFTRLNNNGTRDTGFDTGSGPNVNSIYAIIVQPDGKILVGGMFNQFNGVTAPAIMRLNADGTRDTGFTLLLSAFPNNIRAMALQPDGKILLVGEFVDFDGVTQNRITRFNADGTRDTGFTSGTGFERTVYTIALQSDGKILVGGNFRLYNGVTQNRITRLNSNGTRDTGFATGTGFDGDVNTIVVQPNGNILVGGSFASYNGTTQRYIVRLTSSGQQQLLALPVATYAVTSLTINTGTGFNNAVYYIVVQPNGNILVGGDFTSYNGTTQNRITRLNADGIRDTGFVIGTGFNNRVSAIAVQSDGKILVGGFFTTYNGVTQNYITRLNANGSKDTNLSGTGQGFSSSVATIVLQSDGNIFVGGSFSSYVGEAQYGISRLAGAGGNTYPGFSTGNGFADQRNVRAIAIQSDGKILVGGDFTIFNGTLGPNYLVRLNADGTRDTVFNNNLGTSFTSNVYDIAVQSDGKILVGGNFTAYNGVYRNRIIVLNTDGSLLTFVDINEGSQYNFVVNTANVSDSTVLRWRILDRPNDFAVNTGTVTITANSGTFSVTPTADQSLEGSETFRVQVEKLSGTVLSTTGNITINDTSTS